MSIPVSERGYPHPELLAETDWLASRLSDPTVRVVDARSEEDYAAGHIPGAVHLNGFGLGGLRTGPEMPEPLPNWPGRLGSTSTPRSWSTARPTRSCKWRA